jgi:argininosuccinate synthase
MVRLKLYKGTASLVGRKSPFSLYDSILSSFEDDKGLYNQVSFDAHKQIFYLFLLLLL